MSQVKTILGVCGSLRAKSGHRGMLRAAAASLPDGWKLEIADISELPVFNDDLNNDQDRPAAVQRFKEQVQNADAILFSSPEHNYGVATATKNALDWASTKPNCWDDKPAAIMGTGGMHGSGRGQLHFRQLAVFVNLHMLNKPEVMINRYGGDAVFDDDGNLISSTWEERIATLVQALVDWQQRLSK